MKRGRYEGKDEITPRATDTPFEFDRCQAATIARNKCEYAPVKRGRYEGKDEINPRAADTQFEFDRCPAAKMARENCKFTRVKRGRYEDKNCVGLVCAIRICPTARNVAETNS